MPEQKVVISLSAVDIQAVEQAVLDRDAQAALVVLERVIHVQIQKALSQGHCRPTFELQGGTDSPPAPPPLDKSAGK